ncbi:endonuclease [Maribacter aestuarii]|uniref:endonuclease/exonuclease/phosphatase family protein n=1 Tax=Maribacter aestuarii TaxID=1130723 RepID=UPI0025A5B073|nr:endonuclease [Maribacter aestuarii]
MKKNEQLYTVAFYNLENLFDAENNERTLDDDFTPEGFKKWTPKRYEKKLSKVAKTIFGIGKPNNPNPPVLVGVAEAENKTVLQDLVQKHPLNPISYKFVHYESPDERGIDTALLYNPKYFEVIHAEPMALMIKNLDGVRDTTRDILYVKGRLNGEEMHVFVNHWPSRWEGNEATEYKRIRAAEVIRGKMKGIDNHYKEPNFIIMGDFNDDPDSASIQELIADSSLYNPMEKLHAPGKRGSSNYKKTWSLFDQIIISHSFLNYQKRTHSFREANIYDEVHLKEHDGKYEGSPFRTYAGRKYLGGYSDHFPVYIILKYNDN